MKFSSVLLFLVLSFASFAQDELYIVDSPDIAQEGWYWEPTGGGWGLNMTIQPSTQSPTGFYLQGASYTYDDDGNPIWFTFQNPYTPNDDVYAWREGRGPMGSFESLLAISTNGGCLDCPTVPSDAAASDKGTIKLEWSDPLNMTMTVNGTTKVLKHFFFHDGLNNPSADFITQRMWFVHGAHNGYESDASSFDFLKGVAKFSPLTIELQTAIESTSQGRFNFDDTLTWYYMDAHVLKVSLAREQGNDISNPFVNEFSSSYRSVIFLGYDPSTMKANLFVGDYNNFAGDDYSINTCYRSAKNGLSGLLRPAVASSSRFYYDKDETMSQCSGKYLQPIARQIFMDLTALPVGFDDLSNVPGMYESPSE